LSALSTGSQSLASANAALISSGWYPLDCKYSQIEDSFLEKEKQNKKQECIEFSKYIRNGKDHFNNGYSTEMVYNEWLEKYKK